MNTIFREESNRIYPFFRFMDYLVFSGLMIFLSVTVISSAAANIQTDAIDYYAITQRLTQSGGNPIVRNLPFVEQRSPGYPILSLIPYTLLSSLVEPLVHTEEIITPVPKLNFPVLPSERMLLPGQPVLFRDVFFKDFYIETQDSWFRWKIIASMLFTSYTFLLIGLIFCVKSLALEKKPLFGASLAPLVVINLPVFMHNIVMTPAYATLTAFGVSCLFAYFFMKSSLENKFAPQFLSGLFAGFLVLTRLETILIPSIVLAALAVFRETQFLKNFVFGLLPSFVILWLYNLSQFGNPFHLGILAGDINLISLNWNYIYDSLLNPQSGILFWSTLPLLGLTGLFLGKRRHHRVLALSSFALIALFVVRVPIMYHCVGEGIKFIGGLPVTCPDHGEAVNLVRFDINRYMIVLTPFSIIGLERLLASTPVWIKQILQLSDRKTKSGSQDVR